MGVNTNTAVKKIAGINLPVLALLWVCVAWGSTWVVAKIGVGQVPPLQMCALRQLFGGAIWISFFLFKKRPFPQRSQWPIILLMSLLNFVLSNGLSTWGVKYISAGLGAILGAIFPLWIVIIYLFKGKKIVPLAVIGMLLGFSGVCIIFYDHLEDFLIPDFRFGIIISIVATITWAFGSLYTQEQMHNFNPYFGLGIQMFISGIFLYGFTSATGQTIPLQEISPASWQAIAYLVIIGSVCTFAAYLYTLKHLPIEIASIYAYINPVVAVLMGTYYFDEKLTIGILAGGLVTLAGVYLVNYAMRKNKT